MPYPTSPDTTALDPGASPTDTRDVVALPLLVKPAEAARLLSVERTTIYRLLDAGEIRSIAIGRGRRIVVASLHDYIARKLEPR
jgi:excisionase family DNA binding protein